MGRRVVSGLTREEVERRRKNIMRAYLLIPQQNKKACSVVLDNSQIMLTTIAVESLNTKTGIINVNAKINLEKKQEIVDSHISLTICLFSDSSEM